MKVCGIIAEFNPLHNGHKFLIDQVKEQIKPDFLIVVMSGNYVQRGEISLIDKWEKTKMALKSDVDLVVELPFQAAVASADIFAENAVKLLADLGCTDLVFGTEDIKFNYIEAAQKIIASEKDSSIFEEYTQSYANQINNFYTQNLGITIRNPNQMLGLNYALAIIRNHYPINIIPISRVGVKHDDSKTVDSFASASRIRQNIKENKPIKNLIPIVTENILNNSSIISQNYFKYLKYKIIMTDEKDLEKIYQMVEGLEFRVKSAIRNVDSLSELIEAIKTKRYTYARIRRLLLYVLLNVTKEDIDKANLYHRILGFNKNGQTYLRKIKKNTQYPIVTKVSKNTGENILALQIKVDSFIEFLDNSEQNFKRQPIMEL